MTNLARKSFETSPRLFEPRLIELETQADPRKNLPCPSLGCGGYDPKRLVEKNSSDGKGYNVAACDLARKV